MHDLIRSRTVADEVKDLLSIQHLPCWTYSKVFEDNNGALILAMIPQMTPHLKHIMLKYHFLKDYVHFRSHTN